MAGDTALSPARAPTHEHGGRWLWLALLPLGFGAWVPLRAGLRTRHAAWVAGGAALCVLWLVGIALAADGHATGTAGGILLWLAWLGAAGYALAIRRTYDERLTEHAQRRPRGQARDRHHTARDPHSGARLVAGPARAATAWRRLEARQAAAALNRSGGKLWAWAALVWTCAFLGCFAGAVVLGTSYAGRPFVPGAAALLAPAGLLLVVPAALQLTGRLRVAPDGGRAVRARLILLAAAGAMFGFGVWLLTHGVGWRLLTLPGLLWYVGVLRGSSPAVRRTAVCSGPPRSAAGRGCGRRTSGRG